MKTVLITGAGSGIGLAATRLFLKKDYIVFAHYHNSCDALAQINSENLKLFKADFKKYGEVEELISKCMATSEIDILVNNAGDYTVKDSLSGVMPNDIEESFRINTIAPFILTKSVISSMIKKKWGRIINISSIGVKYGGNINSIGYTMSKNALESMTLSFAKYCAKDNVLINCIRTGVVDTDFHSKAKNKNMQSRVDIIPMKRLALPDEIAKSIYFLASEESSFCSGTILTVAGGE